jgi:hypothetical protein
VILIYQGRFPHNPKVEGSNPSPATTRFFPLNHLRFSSSHFPPLSRPILSVFLVRVLLDYLNFQAGTGGPDVEK